MHTKYKESERRDEREAMSTRGYKSEREESDYRFSPDREMDLIALSKGKFDG